MLLLARNEELTCPQIGPFAVFRRATPVARERPPCLIPEQTETVRLRGRIILPSRCKTALSFLHAYHRMIKRVA
jgi:hypothetical protein